MPRRKSLEEPQVTLRLLDVHGRPLSEPVDLMLRHQGTGDPLLVRRAQGDPIVVGGCQSGVYLVEADPPSYVATASFVMSGAKSPLVMTFPIDPRKVVKASFPTYAQLTDDARRLLKTKEVLGFDGRSGEELYKAFDDIRKAGFHNIMTKSGATGLTNHRPVSSYLKTLKELRGDRFFVVASQELREETKNSVKAGLFNEVSELMHHPPAHFERAGSYKTPDRYGNLQVSFFTDGSTWVVDADIDDANGLEHVFQVLRNELTGRPTHPYDIHEILIAYQKLDPSYVLQLA